MDKAVEELQQELKVLKNEIKETLTDVREVLLNTVENPFPQDTSSRSMSGAPTAPPPAAPRPAPVQQQEMPPQMPMMPQQGGMGGGGQGGGPVFMGNLGGGGGFQGMPQMSMPAPAQFQDAHLGAPPAQSHAPEQTYHDNGSSGEGATNDGPGLPPTGARRDRPADGGGRASDGPGLPPRAREAVRERGRDDERDSRDQRPPRGGREPEPTRSTARGRGLGARRPAPASEDSAPDDERYKQQYEEPYEGDAAADYREEDRPKGKVDLVVLASLSPWLTEGIRRVGRKRIKAVLDIFASMGGMSRELKDVATQIVDLDDTEGPHEQVSVQDSMRLLIELDDLMWRGRQDWRRAALMTMLSADERLRP